MAMNPLLILAVFASILKLSSGYYGRDYERPYGHHYDERPYGNNYDYSPRYGGHIEPNRIDYGVRPHSPNYRDNLPNHAGNTPNNLGVNQPNNLGANQPNNPGNLQLTIGLQLPNNPQPTNNVQNVPPPNRINDDYLPRSFDNGDRRSFPISRSSTKFGCDFHNRTYKYDLDHRPDGNPLVYGSIINTLRFNSMDEFLNVFERLEMLYKEFIEDVVYNDMDISIKLFKHCNGRNFEDCYRAFYPSFDDDDDASHLAVSWLDRLVDRWPRLYISDMAPYVYLTAADLKESLGDVIGRNPHHAAAFIKFEVNKEVGYFLFDPGFGHNKPVVILEDIMQNMNLRKNNATTTGWKNAGHSMNCEYSKSMFSIDCSIILGENPMQLSNINHVFYFMDKPYCSFVRTSMKPSLVNPKRMMIRRDKEGNIVASLSALLLPGSSFINLAYFEITKKEYNINVLKIPVQSAAKCTDMYQHQDFIRKVSAKLDICVTTFKQTITSFAYILVNDANFLRGMAQTKDDLRVKSWNEVDIWDLPNAPLPITPPPSGHGIGGLFGSGKQKPMVKRLIVSHCSV